MIRWTETAEAQAEGIHWGTVILANHSWPPLELFDSYHVNRGFVWLPHLAEFRMTDGFKNVARKMGLVGYWREHGYPDKCRPLGADDFECEVFE